jgi:hypothetical protein
MNNPQSDELTKSRFLDYLDTEIEQVQDEMSRPGWTRWAILGGLATISWLILQEWEKGLINYDYVSALWLAGVVFFFASMSINSLINYDSVFVNRKVIHLTDEN